jgi:hypothetical protein
VRERRILIESAIWLLLVRLGLWLLPFQVLRQWLSRAANPRALTQTPADTIVWAVKQASRYVPRATCLTQALAAQVMLRREGFPAQVRIGVALNSKSELKAHAWLESEGKILIGDSEVDRFTPLPRFDGVGI